MAVSDDPLADLPSEFSTLGTDLTREDMVEGLKTLTKPKKCGLHVWTPRDIGRYTFQLTPDLVIELTSCGAHWNVGAYGGVGYYRLCPSSKSVEYAQRRALMFMRTEYRGESRYYDTLADTLDELLEKKKCPRRQARS